MQPDYGTRTVSLRSASSRRALTGLLLVLAAGACSRRSAEVEPGAGGSSAAPASASVALPARTTALPPRKPAAPPVTPELPPQLVACGERDFYRITQSALQVFEIAPQQPPPQIRGSRVARQTTEIKVNQPSNVVPFGKRSVLVLGKDALLGYELGQTQARSYTPLPVAGPLVAWAEPRAGGSLRLRRAADTKLEEYTLAPLASGAAGAPSNAVPATPRAVPLPEFDGRLFTMLADGTPLFTTGKGLVRLGHETKPLALPELSGPATLLLPDSSAERYWAADATGKLGLWSVAQPAAPLSTSSVPGVVIDAAADATRVAVLGIEAFGHEYRPAVTVFVNGKQQVRLPLGPQAAALGQPQIDVCLVRGRPWVVVGGALWLQLLDWESRRLLAEW